MNIQKSLTAVLAHPSTDTLWQLRGALRQAGWLPEAAVWPILDHFYEFLNHLSAGADAHQYSQLASLMDIGAVGGVALENLLQSDSTEELWKKFLAGSISEGLMVLASRQYIKAFKTEVSTIYQTAAWFLFDALWRLSTKAQPELPPAARRQHLDALLAPIHDNATPETVKIALVGLLFQTLLLAYLSGENLRI